MFLHRNINSYMIKCTGTCDEHETEVRRRNMDRKTVSHESVLKMSACVRVCICVSECVRRYKTSSETFPARVPATWLAPSIERSIPHGPLRPHTVHLAIWTCSRPFVAPEGNTIPPSENDRRRRSHVSAILPLARRKAVIGV